MGLSYKRYIATTSNLHSKLSAIIVLWENSDKIYPESLGNCLYHGINFVSSMLFLVELWLLKIGHFWCKMRGGFISLVAKLVQRGAKIRSHFSKAIYVQYTSRSNHNPQETQSTLVSNKFPYPQPQSLKFQLV